MKKLNLKRTVRSDSGETCERPARRAPPDRTRPIGVQNERRVKRPALNASDNSVARPFSSRDDGRESSRARRKRVRPHSEGGSGPEATGRKGRANGPKTKTRITTARRLTAREEETRRNARFAKRNRRCRVRTSSVRRLRPFLGSPGERVSTSDAATVSTGVQSSGERNREGKPGVFGGSAKSTSVALVRWRDDDRENGRPVTN